MIRLAAIFPVYCELSRKCLKFTNTLVLNTNAYIFMNEYLLYYHSLIVNIYIRDKKNIITEIADLVDFIVHVYILHFFLFR